MEGGVGTAEDGKTANEHLAWLVEQGASKGVVDGAAVGSGLEGQGGQGGGGQVCFVKDMAELVAAIQVMSGVCGGRYMGDVRTID